MGDGRLPPPARFLFRCRAERPSDHYLPGVGSGLAVLQYVCEAAEYSRYILTTLSFKSFGRVFGALTFGRSPGASPPSGISAGMEPSFRTETDPLLAVSRIVGPSPTFPLSVAVRPSRS